VVLAVGVAAIVVILVVAVVASSSVFSGGDGDGDGRDAAASATSTTGAATSSTAAPAVSAGAPSTTSAPSTTAPGPAPIDVDRRYAVSTYQVTYVDPSRTTSPNGSFEGASNRTLDTTYWFPALTDGGEPDRAHGPYPVVLFVHGYDQTADFYAPLLERWASAGYVVIGPTFPILSGIPGGASHVDYSKLFGDAAFVLDQTLAAGAGTPIAGLSDGARIAAAGHSDGEMVSFTLGFGQCCREPRIRSVITMAGDLSNAGIDPMRDTGMPILHVMETNDEYDPYQHSIDYDRDNLTAPRWMLTLVNGSHVPPYTQPGNAYFELVSVATVDFLDGTLKDRPDRLDQLAADVAAHPDIANLER
jgi:hypothetical protein